MKWILWMTALCLGFPLLPQAAPDQTMEYRVARPASNLEPNDHRNRYAEAKKALGIQNMRVHHAKRAGKISPAQAKELFKLVTAGFRQAEDLSRQNGGNQHLTQEQLEQVLLTRDKARQAIDAVLGPEPPETAPGR
ncbi:MAG TPA: hypothetical protein VMV05_09660 [bacterium]|nr:hypothetical protein [bacterium]